MSSYSQTDLSCILGEKNRKKIKLEEKSIDEKEKGIAPENSKFVQGGSINDYFKMKMKMMSEKKATKLSESYIFPKDNNVIISRHSNINRSTLPPDVICPVRVKVVLDV